MHWFFFRLQISHLLLFLLAPSSTAPRGIPAVPRMWRPWLFSSERGEACVGRFVGNAVVGSKAKFSHVLSSEQFSSNTWRFFLAFNSASIGIAFGGRPKKCLCWPESAASQRSKYSTNIGMLFYDISNLKILMSKDSRGCKQNILKKWLTEALKNRFSLHQKQAKKKAFDDPIMYRTKHCESRYCWMSWALKKCMIWVGVMLHDEEDLRKQILWYRPWYWYLVILFQSATSWDVHSSCWDRLNSIKPGPGRLQFLRWASMRFLGPFVRFEDIHRTPRNRGHNGLAPTSSQPIGWSPPKTVVLNRESFPQISFGFRKLIFVGRFVVIVYGKFFKPDVCNS